jgi:hypothetical protein
MNKPRIMVRFEKGALVPADRASREILRDRAYHVGDILAAALSKPRNYKFFGKAHILGRLVAESIEGFEGMEPHAVLKRLQIEGDIACDRMVINLPNYGPVDYRVAQSLAFESMDESEFTKIYTQFAQYISERYWPDCDAEQIEKMADAMPEAA